MGVKGMFRLPGFRRKLGQWTLIFKQNRRISLKIIRNYYTFYIYGFYIGEGEF